MCSLCDPYADELPITRPASLIAVVDMIQSAQRAGDLEWLDGDAVVQALSADALTRSALGTPAPALHGRWLCTQCSRMFLLEVNAGTTLGDTWRPLYGN